MMQQSLPMWYNDGTTQKKDAHRERFFPVLADDWTRLATTIETNLDTKGGSHMFSIPPNPHVFNTPRNPQLFVISNGREVRE